MPVQFHSWWCQERAWGFRYCMTVYLERGYNHNEELKSLTRYRFDKVKERAKLKMSISWLSCILFPELKKLGLTLHMVSVYVLLSEFTSTY